MIKDYLFLLPSGVHVGSIGYHVDAFIFITLYLISGLWMVVVTSFRQDDIEICGSPLGVVADLQTQVVIFKNSWMIVKLKHVGNSVVFSFGAQGHQQCFF